MTAERTETLVTCIRNYKFTELYEESGQHDLAEHCKQILESLGDPTKDEQAWRRLGYVMAKIVTRVLPNTKDIHPIFSEVSTALQMWLYYETSTNFNFKIDDYKYAPQATSEAVAVFQEAAKVLRREDVIKAVAEATDLILEGYAAFPGSQGRRDLFNWWLKACENSWDVELYLAKNHQKYKQELHSKIGLPLSIEFLGYTLDLDLTQAVPSYIRRATSKVFTAGPTIYVYHDLKWKAGIYFTGKGLDRSLSVTAETLEAAETALIAEIRKFDQETTSALEVIRAIHTPVQPKTLAPNAPEGMDTVELGGKVFTKVPRLGYENSGSTVEVYARTSSCIRIRRTYFRNTRLAHWQVWHVKLSPNDNDHSLYSSLGEALNAACARVSAESSFKKEAFEIASHQYDETREVFSELVSLVPMQTMKL